MKYKFLILSLFFFVCIITPIFFYIFDYDKNFFNQIFSIDFKIKELIQNNFFFTLIIFFIFNFFTTAINSPGGSLKCILTGYYFDIYVGLFISLIPITLGSYFVYYANASLVSSIRENNFKKIISYLNSKYLTNPFLILVTIRLLLFIPLSIQNLFLSSLNISKEKFFITTLIGLFPTIFIYNFLGSLVKSISELQHIKLVFIKDFNLFIIFIILVIFMILFSIILSWIEKRFK